LQIKGLDHKRDLLEGAAQRFIEGGRAALTEKLAGSQGSSV